MFEHHMFFLVFQVNHALTCDSMAPWLMTGNCFYDPIVSWLDTFFSCQLYMYKDPPRAWYFQGGMTPWKSWKNPNMDTHIVSSCLPDIIWTYKLYTILYCIYCTFTGMVAGDARLWNSKNAKNMLSLLLILAQIVKCPNAFPLRRLEQSVHPGLGPQ